MTRCAGKGTGYRVRGTHAMGERVRSLQRCGSTGDVIWGPVCKSKVSQMIVHAMYMLRRAHCVYCMDYVYWVAHTACVSVWYIVWIMHPACIAYIMYRSVSQKNWCRAAIKELAGPESRPGAPEIIQTSGIA